MSELCIFLGLCDIVVNRVKFVRYVIEYAKTGLKMHFQRRRSIVIRSIRIWGVSVGRSKILSSVTWVNGQFRISIY